MAYTTINKSTDYFENNYITQVMVQLDVLLLDESTNMQPDLMSGLKGRRDGAENHGLFDAVRGATKTLSSNATSAESTRSGSLTSFDNDGWSMGGSDGIISASGSTYVGWAWKANGQGSANTDGSINTTYTSVNTTAGFSISKYTGTSSSATVGHGLGVAPKMIITKQLSGTSSWGVYHVSRGNGVGMILNETGTGASSATYWNNTTPTSSVFSIGTDAVCNANGQDFIAYCFAEKQGYSKFGSYAGNGNVDGNFVYTGFKPSWIMFRRYDTAGEWLMYDNKRDPHNLVDTRLEAQANFADSTSSGKSLDFLSNGFKIRGDDGDINTNGGTYIYMAFGQSIVGSNNIPATAR